MLGAWMRACVEMVDSILRVADFLSVLFSLSFLLSRVWPLDDGALGGCVCF